MKTYPLFAFSDNHHSEQVLVTRGATLDDALDHASNSSFFRRGVTIFPLSFVPIQAAELYGHNHAPGWLHRMPEYMRRREAAALQKEVIVCGPAQVQNRLIQECVSALRERCE